MHKAEPYATQQLEWLLRFGPSRNQGLAPTDGSLQMHFDIGWGGGRGQVSDFIASQQVEIGLFNRLAQLFHSASFLHDVGSPAHLRQLDRKSTRLNSSHL